MAHFEAPRPKVWGALAFLVFVAILLRLPGIGDWSLYRDDAWQSLVSRVDSLWEVIRTGVVSPGYALFLRVWTSLFGDGSVSLLVPALLAGILLVPATVFLARRFHLSWPASLLAGALIVVGGIAIHFSARVKPFVIDAMVTVMLVGIAKTLLKSLSLPRLTAFASLVLAAFFFSASTATVGVAAMGILLVAAWRSFPSRRPALIVLTAGLGGVAMALYLLLVAPATTEVLRDFWSGRLAPLSLGAGFPGRLVVLAGGFLISHSPGGWILPAWVAVALVALLVIVGTGKLLAARRWEDLTLLLGPVLLAAALAIAGISPFGGGRTDLYLYPLVAVVAGVGFETLGHLLARNARTGLALASVVALVLLLSARPVEYREDDGRAVTAAVLAAAESEDMIITLPETSYLWARYAPGDVGVEADDRAMTGFTPTIDDERLLFLPGYELTGTEPATRSARSSSLRQTRAEIEQQSPHRVWVVEATLFESNVLPELNALLDESGYRPIEQIELPLAKATLWADSPR